MIQNQRDLGGICTATGARIKTCCLIRSANLSEATESDLSGISTVIDLRTSMERAQAPDRYYKVTYRMLPIFDEQRSGISHEKETQGQEVPDMVSLYRQMVEKNGDAFGKVLMTIMQHDFSSGAVLWHCTEGKDRCGLTTAFLLEMLGVSREVIMADYLKTNEVNLLKAQKLKEQLIKVRGEAFAEQVYRAFIADRSYLEAAWDAMGERYFERIGISEAAIDAFRAAVLG